MVSTRHAVGFFLSLLASAAASAMPTGDVTLSIDATAGASPISPLIYGVNGGLRPSGVGALRLGGNRWTGYNWETNNSNAGEDFFHFNDEFLTGAFGQTTPPGEAVRPTLQEAATLGAATNVTVPMAGFVSADANGTVAPAETAPSSRWLASRPKKASVYPGSALSLTPDLSDGFVFADEFVNWVEANRQNDQQVNYLLDNEPGLWDDTHPYLYGSVGPTFADVGQRSIATASAIKDVAPGAKVLGGVTFGWDAMFSLNGAPDFDQQVPPQGRAFDELHFNRWLLATMAAEEQTQGRVLMDALDLHWYPEAQGGGVRIIGTPTLTPELIEARVQAPRSLWDPTYVEESYITQFFTTDDQGAPAGIELLNRVKSDIDELKPGTLVSVSEYNYGGGDHISGAVAQADALGVFGREGVYNASWWPIEGESNAPFVEAGFEMFTDFDGQGGRFGDLSLDAESDDIARASVYASRSAANPGEMILVVINRSGEALDAAIQIADSANYTTAEVYRLTDAAAQPVAGGSLAIDGLNEFLYAMPAYSVSTLRLIAEAAPGDFDGDGDVDDDDFGVFAGAFGGAGPIGDFDGDGDVDDDDFGVFAGAFGTGVASDAVPEPSGAAALLLGALAAARGRRRLASPA